MHVRVDCSNTERWMLLAALSYANFPFEVLIWSRRLFGFGVGGNADDVSVCPVLS